MLKYLCTTFSTGDTWRFTITSGAISWDDISSTTGPSARYGFVSGVINNWWIISHGNKSVSFVYVNISIAYCNLKSK